MKSPLITMSAITGKPTETEIYEYLKSLRDVGIEQCMLYPRSGCELEYLSEEWFNTISYFISSARKLDMCIWLYDDFNWPSGDAQGRVSAVPEYRLSSIVIRGEDMGKISQASRHNSDLFGEKYFPNLLSYEAMDYFIKCTHEEYYARFGEYFGSVIKGIFTDEPSIGYCCEKDSIPYYEGMEGDYNARFNRDFSSDMKIGYENFCLYSMELVSDRFKECFIDKISSWCKNHGIVLTGHLLCDDNPFYAVKHGGNFLKNLSSFALPGIDDIYTDFESADKMTLFGTAEYVGNGKGATAELFALGPCDMTYAKKKCMLYFAACHKIDHYFLAISHLDMRGNTRVCDYYSDFSSSQPDFYGMHLLAKEAERAREIAQKDFTPNVYIRYPYYLSAKHIVENISLEALWQITKELTLNQIQWKFVNSDLEIKDSCPLIELGEKGELLFNKLPLSAKEICEKINTSPVVLDLNGNLPKGIFVRKLTDGTTVVLNLFGEENEYIVFGNKVYLHKHQALVFDSSYKQESYVEEKIKHGFNVVYSNDNIIRLMLLNEQSKAKILCDKDITVRFAVRNDAYATLNGENIECTSEPSCLPKGMQKLYKISNQIVLNKGESVVESKNDYKYMPSVFVIGDFCSEQINGEICALQLMPRAEKYDTGSRILDFGTVRLEAELTVPKGATHLKLEGTELYTRVYINNELQDENIAGPYIFKLDKKWQGEKAVLTIEQRTSIGNIFGNTYYWDKNVASCQWRGTPSTNGSYIGFTNCTWLIDDN